MVPEKLYKIGEVVRYSSFPGKSFIIIPRSG